MLDSSKLEKESRITQISQICVDTLISADFRDLIQCRSMLPGALTTPIVNTFRTHGLRGHLRRDSLLISHLFGAWVLWSRMLHSEVFITLGLLLGASLFVAALIGLIRVPKVTAYLLVGMLAGAHGFDLVPTETMHALLPFAEMAMALVLFNLGTHFPIAKLRRMGRLLPLSFGEQTVALVVVTMGLWLCTENVMMSVLLGTLSLATAPATTALVLKEVQSRGPVTELASGLVVLNNLTCILLFEIFLLVCVGVRHPTGIIAGIGHLAWGFLQAFVLGAAGGLLVSYFCGLLSSKKWLVLLVAVASTLLGICDHVECPYMLAFLTMGAIVASFSAETKKLALEIDNLTTLLCVVFFVYHGSELNARQFVNAGLVGVVYIGCRVVGKSVGVSAAAKVMNECESVQKWLGLTLLAQAGTAIALCSISIQRDAVLGRELQTIILGSVVFFEIIGPLCIRFGVLQAGEVPIAQAIYHVGHTPLGQARELWSRVRDAFGGGRVRPLERLLVSDLMRPSQSISEDATFEDVVKHIENSPDDVFPVVNSLGVPVGVIRYNEINDVLYDPYAGELIRASDVMVPLEKSFVKSHQASLVIDYLSNSDDGCAFVTNAVEPYTFVGVVRRSDVTTMLIQERKSFQN